MSSRIKYICISIFSHDWMINFPDAGIKYMHFISLSAKWRQENVNKQPLENKFPVGKRMDRKIPILLMVLCTQGILVFPMCSSSIHVGFSRQENEAQVWWSGIFVTKYYR